MKILLVDDSSFIILICRQALEKSGYEVIGEAYDGFKAIELAQQLKPDVVVMDIALPGKNGFEATKLIHEFLPKTKVLAISALDEDWIREKAIEAGCVDFLEKPFEAVELIDRIAKLKDSEGDLKYG